MVWRHTGERNLFICQVTVSHHGIKQAASLIRKNQCVHCGGFPLWVHSVLKRSISDKDIYSSKIYLRLDLFCWNYHITQSKRTAGKSKASLSFNQSQVNISSQVILSACHQNMTCWYCLGKLKRCRTTVNTPPANAAVAVDDQPWQWTLLTYKNCKGREAQKGCWERDLSTCWHDVENLTAGEGLACLKEEGGGYIDKGL